MDFTLPLLPLLATALCYAVAGILLWKCYRLTGNLGFVWLGGALWIWPAVGLVVTPLTVQLARQAADSREAWPFPFSLIGGPNPAMTVGEFLQYYRGLMAFCSAALMTAALGFMARGCRTSIKPPGFESPGHVN